MIVQKKINSFVSLLLSIFLYLILVFMPLSTFELLAFCGIILGILLLSVQLSIMTWFDACYSFSLLMFGSLLALKWSTAVTHTGILGGLLPNDADPVFYYFDALRLIEGQTFSTFSTNRPISTAFIAVLLWITRNDLQITVVILTFILASASFLFVVEIAKSHGVFPASISFLLLFSFSIKFVGTFYTENIGLTMGVLGMMILWYTVNYDCKDRKCWAALFLGVFLLTTAMFARSGAMFALFGVLLWSILISLRKKSLYSWVMSLVVISAIITCYLANDILVRSVGSSDGSAFSNFALVLYGQVVGGKGWLQVFGDYPDLVGQDIFQKDFASRVYLLAWNAFLANPTGLLWGTLKAWSDFLSLGTIGQFSFVPGNSLIVKIFRAILTFIWFIGFITCFARRQDSRLLLLLTVTLGILLSVPFVPPIDAGRARVYAATIPVTAGLIAIGVHRIMSYFKLPKWFAQPLENSFQSNEYRLHLTVAAAVFVFIVFTSPIVLRLVTLDNNSSSPTLSCSPGLTEAVIRVSPGAMLLLVDNIARTRVPIVKINDFKTGLQGKLYSDEFMETMKNTEPDTVLFYAVDVNHGSGWLFTADRSITEYSFNLIAVCGYIDKARVFHVRSFYPFQ